MHHKRLFGIKALLHHYGPVQLLMTRVCDIVETSPSVDSNLKKMKIAVPEMQTLRIYIVGNGWLSNHSFLDPPAAVTQDEQSTNLGTIGTKLTELILHYAWFHIGALCCSDKGKPKGTSRLNR